MTIKGFTIYKREIPKVMEHLFELANVQFSQKGCPYTWATSRHSTDGTSILPASGLPRARLGTTRPPLRSSLPGRIAVQGTAGMSHGSGTRRGHVPEQHALHAMHVHSDVSKRSIQARVVALQT